MATGGKGGSLRQVGRRIFRSELAVLAILLVMCAIMSIVSENFLTVSNLLNVLQRSAITGIVALGMTFVVLTGGIDLSVGGQVVLIGVVGALMMVNGKGIPMAVLTMLGMGIVVGALNGFNVSMLGLPPFIATLAMLNITKGLSLLISQGKTIFGLPDAYEVFGLGWWLGIPVPVWILGILTVLAYVTLRYTAYGRRVYAVGSSPRAAWLSGIDVRKTVFSVYIVSGLLSGVTAVVLSSRLLSAPGTMGSGLELDAVAAVVIGGTSLMGGEGNVLGTIIGTVIIEVIANSLNLLSVSPFLQDVVKGLIILVALILDMWRKGAIFKRSFVE
ncbi:MAG: ABC transporter permease [Firmicutes bacterium]|nr:ABC transporter permease [Bacillota bacterium]